MRGRPASGKVVTYGFDDSADWHIASVGTARRQDGRSADVVHDRRALPAASCRCPAAHMVANAVAALAVASLSGEATQPAVAALAKFGAPEGRGPPLRLGPNDKPLLLVDES